MKELKVTYSWTKDTTGEYPTKPIPGFSNSQILARWYLAPVNISTNRVKFQDGKYEFAWHPRASVQKTSTGFLALRYADISPHDVEKEFKTLKAAKQFLELNLGLR